MDYEEQSLNSMPTMVGVARPLRADIDEPSLGSAPTMVPGRAGDALGRIDQYDLVSKLGGGGFGVVYLARDTVSGIDVALKTLHPLLKSNPEEMEALRAKFALVSRLSHPNIASALVLHPCQRVDVWDETVRRELRLVPGDFVMVMRYAPGVTLSKWRRQFPGGSVPLAQALEIGRQIATALDYAHGERIVHRDIKPANVMVETLDGASSPGDPTLVTRHSSLVTSKIRARILDFGLAAEIRSSMSRVSSETGDTSGTRPYMAPEQWLGRKQDGRTDQYALACVLYELLSGEPPFAGVFETGDPVIMKDAVVRDVPEEIEGVPPAVNAALQKALAKNPKERFGSCAEFVAGCLAQSPQSSQRKYHTEAQRHREAPQGVKPLGGATSPLPASPTGPDVPPRHAEPRKKSGKGWLVAALGAAAVMAGLRFASVSKGGASSPGEPQRVWTSVSSPATQDNVAKYERRIAEALVAEARAYGESKLWQKCLDTAGKALEWDAGNRDALALKTEAQGAIDAERRAKEEAEAIKIDKLREAISKASKRFNSRWEIVKTRGEPLNARYVEDLLSKVTDTGEQFMAALDYPDEFPSEVFISFKWALDYVLDARDVPLSIPQQKKLESWRKRLIEVKQ